MPVDDVAPRLLSGERRASGRPGYSITENENVVKINKNPKMEYYQKRKVMKIENLPKMGRPPTRVRVDVGLGEKL